LKTILQGLFFNLLFRFKEHTYKVLKTLQENNWEIIKKTICISSPQLMKTKRSRLAPMVVKILLCQGLAQEIATYSGTTRVVRKEVVLLKIFDSTKGVRSFNF
jgi:hypothetical protein